MSDQEPRYKGDGEHSVNQLEAMVKQLTKENLEWQAKVQGLADALNKISEERYEANPWTIVPTSGAKIASEALRQFTSCQPAQGVMVPRDETIREARDHFKTWPDQLWTGVMFFKGERITREEFEAIKGIGKDGKK